MADRVQLVHGADRCVVDPHGATVVSWVRGGREQLYVSPRASAAPGRAIRGGIPVCAPWFASRPGHPEAPSHGVARTRPWAIEEVAPDRVRLALVDRVDTRADWPFAFHFALEVVLSDALHVRFVHTNTAPVAVEVAGALHTYVRAHDATLHGLEDSPFHDKLVGQDRPPEHRPLVVDQAMDRIYAGRPVVRVAHAEGTLVAEQDTPAVVVWNPGAEKAAAMPDLGAGEHRAFVCVEAAATQLQTVVSGGTWSLSQRLRVES